MREIREILADLSGEIQSMKEAGLSPEIVEDGATFDENALIKARTVHEAAVCAGYTDALVLADDSGLEIDALGGAPGVYSARFMGEDTPYEIKNAALIDKLADTPENERTARFRCAIAAVLPDGEELLTDASVDGIIAYGPSGSNGFGYDPILYYPPRGCTLACLTDEEKNAISHRGKALRRMRDILGDRLK